MKITTKGFYAVEMLAALARWRGSLRMTLADLEEATGIPRPYLAHMLLRLKQTNLVVSFRGNGGGCMLQKKPSHILLGDIFKAAGEHMTPWESLSGKMPPQLRRHNRRRPLVCPLNPTWQKLYRDVNTLLSRITLEDFL